MNSQPDEIFELLSGMLDGVLTDEEQSRVDAALREDPDLAVMLDELAALRSSLLRGRSVGRLRTGFSSEVIAKAKERAAEMGDEAPEWIAVPEIESLSITPLKPVTASDRAFRVWLPGLLLATAAAIAIFVFSMPYVNDVRHSVVENMAGSNDGKRENEDATNVLGNDISNNLATNPIKEESNSKVADVPINDTATIAANDNSHTEAEKEIEPSLQDRIAMSNEADKQKDPTNPLVKNWQNNPEARVVLIVELAMDPTAQQNDALGGLLTQHELVYADDLALSSDQLNSLVSSKIVGAVGEAGNGPGFKESLVFVRGRASKLNALTDDLMKQYKDFPHFHLNMSMDSSVADLMAQLSSIHSADERPNFSSRMVFSENEKLGLVTAFPVVDPSTKSMAIDVRTRGSPAKQLDKDPISFLLLMVRN